MQRDVAADKRFFEAGRFPPHAQAAFRVDVGNGCRFGGAVLPGDGDGAADESSQPLFPDSIKAR